jgi:hypothetical protein
MNFLVSLVISITLVRGWLSVHHALAFGCFDCQNRALSVIQLPSIPEKIRLPQVAMEIFGADIVVDANDAALQKSMAALGSVCVYVAANIFFDSMLYYIVTASKLRANATIAAPFIAANPG